MVDGRPIILRPCFGSIECGQPYSLICIYMTSILPFKWCSRTNNITSTEIRFFLFGGAHTRATEGGKGREEGG